MSPHSHPSPAPATSLVDPPFLRIAVPPGIGDALWSLTKVPALLKQTGAAGTHVTICGAPFRQSKPFIERFEFVTGVEYSTDRCIYEDRFTEEGINNWIPSCPRWLGRHDWLLQANRSLESGRRLEAWLPEIETDWHIADRFLFTGNEVHQARQLEELLGPYCVFFMGPERGNTVAGHNRGPLWSPKDWQRLADLCRALGLAVVVVGAQRDRSYFDNHVAYRLGEYLDAIGKWHIGQTFAVIQRSRFVVSYQSGLGIFAVYMDVPAAIFWRPHGDSLNPDNYLTFREEMAAAWAPPESLASGRYLPLIYTRCTPESIVQHAEEYGWHMAGCRFSVLDPPRSMPSVSRSTEP